MSLGAYPVSVFAPGNPQAAMSTTQLNAAANWIAFSFMGKGKTFDNFRFNVSTLTGSGVTVTLALQADSAGAPSGTDLQTVTGVSLSATGWKTATGFSTALTDQTRYWIVIKNTTGTPASNFPTIQYSLSAAPVWLSPTASTGPWGWGRRTTTNSGGTWATVSSAVGYRVGYSDSTYDGMPLDSITSTGTGDGIFGTQETGNLITAPSNVILNVLGFAVILNAWTGTPTVGIRYRIYDGSNTTPIASTATFSPVRNPSTQLWQEGFFSSSVALSPRQSYRLTVGEDSNSDTSSNRWNARVYVWDATSDSRALLPFNPVETTLVSGVWFNVVADANAFVPMVLLLDPTTPFTSLGKGPSMWTVPPRSTRRRRSD